MKSVALKNIAYELKVSVNTVSRALRDCDDISEETKNKVRQKAIEMGYMPNSISQFVKRDKKISVSIVVDDLHNLYFSIVCEKLFQQFKEKNYDFNLVYANEKVLSINIIKQCISQRTDVILTFLEPLDDSIEIAKLYNLPIIMIGRYINNDYVDKIYTDDNLGGSLAANYLVNYHKINKLIYIDMPGVESSKRKKDSFVETASSLLKDDGSIEILNVSDVNKKLLDLIYDDYLGIFCFNDEIAYECLSILNKKIPNIRKIFPRLHIVGYDTLSNHINGLVDLTSIEFSYNDICAKTFEIIDSKMKNPNCPTQSVKFPVKLHQRRFF